MARRHGATIQDNTRLDEITPGHVISLKTSGATYWAKQVILCPGPWAKTLLNKLGVDVPLKTIPGHQCYWKVKPGSEYYFSTDVMPIFNYYVKGEQEEGTSGYQLLYGFPSMEYPGLVKVCYIWISVTLWLPQYGVPRLS